MPNAIQQILIDTASTIAGTIIAAAIITYAKHKIPTLKKWINRTATILICVVIAAVLFCVIAFSDIKWPAQIDTWLLSVITSVSYMAMYLFTGHFTLNALWLWLLSLFAAVSIVTLCRKLWRIIKAKVKIGAPTVEQLSVLPWSLNLLSQNNMAAQILRFYAATGCKRATVERLSKWTGASTLLVEREVTQLVQDGSLVATRRLITKRPFGYKLTASGRQYVIDNKLVPESITVNDYLPQGDNCTLQAREIQTDTDAVEAESAEHSAVDNSTQPPLDDDEKNVLSHYDQCQTKELTAANVAAAFQWKILYADRVMSCMCEKDYLSFYIDDGVTVYTLAVKGSDYLYAPKPNIESPPELSEVEKSMSGLTGDELSIAELEMKSLCYFPAHNVKIAKAVEISRWVKVHEIRVDHALDSLVKMGLLRKSASWSSKTVPGYSLTDKGREYLIQNGFVPE